MSQLSNGIEVLLRSPDASDLVNLPAASADVWGQDAILYWDTTANTVKKFVPADSTETEANQGAIIGVASAGKKVGDIEALVLLKCTLLSGLSDAILGAPCVVKYSATTGLYSFQTGAAYNTATNPDITLTKDFAVCAENAAEADGRGKIIIDGKARFSALS